MRDPIRAWKEPSESKPIRCANPGPNSALGTQRSLCWREVFILDPHLQQKPSPAVPSCSLCHCYPGVGKNRVVQGQPYPLLHFKTSLQIKTMESSVDPPALTCLINIKNHFIQEIWNNSVSILQVSNQTSLLCSLHLPSYFYTHLTVIIAQNCEKSYFLFENEMCMAKNGCFVTGQWAAIKKKTDKIVKSHNFDRV